MTPPHLVRPLLKDLPRGHSDFGGRERIPPHQWEGENHEISYELSLELVGRELHQ